MAKAHKTKTAKKTVKKKAAAPKKASPAKKKAATTKAKKKAVPARAPAKKAEPTEAQIRERARQIWLERGRPVGRDEQNWLDAERQLREEG
jgi:hypothetical protein